jgi:hypothetical protein
MNDLKDLLERALGDDDYAGGAPVDAGGDLARGRNRLRRRRTSLATGATATLLVAGLVPVALGGLNGSSAGSHTTASTTATTGTTSSEVGSIALVSYTGKQPRGYTVAWVPQGWAIQGGDLGYLSIVPPKDVLAREGAASQKDSKVTASKRAAMQRQAGKQLGTQESQQKRAADPSDFEGKLVVMSASEDEQHTLGTKISVAGRPGYLRTQEKTQMLSYKSATGRWVDIQAPTLLRWNSTQIAKFAAGVTVSEKATNAYG